MKRFDTGMFSQALQVKGIKENTVLTANIFDSTQIN